MEEKKLVYPNPLVPIKLAGANLEWLQQYELSNEELARFMWDPKDNRHVFMVGDDDGNLAYYEARSVTSKPKCISHGTKPALFLNKFSDTVCIVEDIVSALKVNRFVCGFPLFGSHLTHDQEVATRFKKAIIWLDYDKLDNAFKMVDRLQALGVKCTVVATKKDPKELSHSELGEVIYEELQMLTPDSQILLDNPEEV